MPINLLIKHKDCKRFLLERYRDCLHNIAVKIFILTVNRDDKLENTSYYKTFLGP